MTVGGWDIGGVNLKAVRVDGGAVTAVRSRPFELQRAPEELSPLLIELARDLALSGSDPQAVTMTAELSQLFRSKREGVAFVLDAAARAFGESRVHVLQVEGPFLPVAQARKAPLAVAAANWSATARLAGLHWPDALLIDVGSTTTDIIPIVAGQPAPIGRTDPERLRSSELLYCGAVRTPVEAIASTVCVGGATSGVSAEGFALAGDVHLWRGDLAAEDYSVTPPDGRPATRTFAGERLARVICADREMLADADISAIADSVAAAQVARIAAGIATVRRRHPGISRAVVTGLGDFLALRAAERAGLRARGRRGAVARTGLRPAPWSSVIRSAPAVQVVIKVGGALARDPGGFERAVAALNALEPGHRVLVVPGGGPFANTVREFQRRIPISDDAGHWMAILGMEQYAHTLAERIAGAQLVDTRPKIVAAVKRRRIPVLAPFRWLYAEDPLPHSWDATSDSIAAWVAARLGARRLVLIKPVAGEPGSLVDPYFVRVLKPGIEHLVLPVDSVQDLGLVLGASRSGARRRPERRE